jgi:stage II sporulation protein B
MAMNKARITIRFDRNGQAVAGKGPGEDIPAESGVEAEKFGEYASIFPGDFADDQERSGGGEPRFAVDRTAFADEKEEFGGDTAFGGSWGTFGTGDKTEDVRGRTGTPSEKGRSAPRIISLRKNEYAVVENTGQRGVHNDNDRFAPSAKRNRPLRERTPSHGRRGSEDIPFEYTMDYGEWNSPYEAEIQRIERLIREADRERVHPAVRDEAADSQQEAYPPQHAPFDDDGERRLGPIISEDVYSSSYIRKSKTPWTKIVFSVSSAVVTGVLFGWFVLSMFSGHDDTPVYRGENGIVNDRTGDGGVGGATASNTPTAGGDVNGATGRDADLPPSADQADAGSPSPAGTGANADESANSAASVLELPAQTWIMLQFGVFSTLDGTKQAQQQLFDRGFAGVSEQRDNYFVFAGIAANRDQAIPLKHRLDEAGLETYLKEYPLPAASIPWNGNAGAAAEYFRKGEELVGRISSLCSDHLKNGGGTKLANADLAELYDLHREWSTAYGKAKAGLPGELAAQTEKMNNALNMAVVSLDAYQKNASDSHLWQAEAAAAQYVLLLRGLLAELES